jgi:hypothetical protein
MVCTIYTPVYYPDIQRGLKLVGSHGDGYTMGIFWHQAFSSPTSFGIGYNIYFSTERDTVFSEGVKFLSLNTTGLSAHIGNFTPGDTYYFAVRGMEYDPTWYDPNLLPDGEDGYDGYQQLKVYPETALLADITDTDMLVPIEDIDLFPAYGVIIVGSELIRYISKDVPNNNLIVGERGFLGSIARIHTVDGYDGAKTYDNALVRFYFGCEDDNGFVIQEQSAFHDPHFAHTAADGYKERVKDLLTTDLSGSDADRIDFPAYDYVGWHRTDPDILFSGKCLDTYIGGESFCADGYGGVGRQIRNISFAEQSDRREEMLLERTGETCVLVKRLWKGIICSCFESNRESPEPRCSICFGTGFVSGYEQYFNPRRSDGRILVRFSPTQDDLEMQDAGLESKLIPDCWTLAVPSVKDRDFIIRFNLDGTEEFRYEILNVTRNKLMYGESGGQKFTAQRVRKFDPINQWRVIRSTATEPTTIYTTVGMVSGPGGIAPHIHSLVINENIVALSQINQTTSVSPVVGSGAHNHVIINGQVQEVLGHTHTIILP